VLLLATTTGYQTRAFGDAAARLDVDLVFATDRCHILEDPWQDQAIPVRYHDEPASADAIVGSAAGNPIDGVLCVGDRPTVIAAHVAARLGLRGHPVDAAAVARDKQRTRERMRDAGLPVPWFVPVRVDGDPRSLDGRVHYPCVIKPVALSGSRGVMRADDRDGLAAALARLRAIIERPELRAERNDAHDRALIEGYIPGRELALEGLLHEGTLHVLALFDKPDPLEGPFFEETIYVTPSSLDRASAEEVVDSVAHAAAAIGLWHGPIHAECRVNEAGVFVLEVAARPIGGLCARALQFTQKGVGRGFQEMHTENPSRPLFSLEDLLLRHALGESPDGWMRETCAAGVMMIPIPAEGIYRGVSGVDDARLVPGIDDITITAKVDQILVPLPEGASYLGFIFARGETPAAVEASLRAGHARLRFAVEPRLRVVQSAHGAM
jgi:hypothetical protein